MCYNCGCHLPHNPMGKKRMEEGGPSLIEEDIEVWAKEEGMTVDDAKNNMREELSCDCDHPKPERKPKHKFLSDERLKTMSEGWGMTVHETKHNLCDMLCSA